MVMGINLKPVQPDLRAHQKNLQVKSKGKQPSRTIEFGMVGTQ